MILQTPEPTVPETGRKRGFPPGREQVPLLVAGLGTLLLATAEVQPLFPRTPVSAFTVSPAMPRGWAVVIVALLLVVSVGAIVAGWRRIPTPALAGVLAVGLAGLLINVFVFHRALSVVDLMTYRTDWPADASQFVLPFVTCAAMVVLAVASDKGLASGILMTTGALGYLFYLQVLVQYLASPVSPHPAPGRAVFIGMLGSAVTLVAGMTARGSNATPQPKAGPIAVLLALGAGLAIVAGAAYQWVAYLEPSSTPGYLGLVIPSFTLDILAPAILVAAACLTVAARQDPDRRTAAGVLIAGGFLTLVYFVDSHVFEWMIPIHSVTSPAGPLAASGDIGVTAGLVLIVTGAWLAAGPRLAAAQTVTGPTVTGPAGDPAADHPSDGELARSETTRYLCAAAHFDTRFTRKVIDDVVADGRRAVVPSLGMDMGTVLPHCFAARRRQNIRDTLLVALLLCFLPLLIDYRHLAGLRDMVVLVVLAAIVALAERWISRYRVATRELAPSAFDPARLPWLTAVERRRLSQLLESEHGNISVYGTYSPFVGSGFPRGGWSFAVNTAKGKEDLGRGHGRLEPKPFDIEDLYAAVRDGIQAIGLAGILIENRLLVDGRSIEGDTRFIPDRTARPLTSIAPEPLRALVHAPELQNRAYQCVRMQDWRGDLILSVFVNFTKRGTGLLVEIQYYLLNALRDQYREVDLLASRPTRRRIRTELAGAPWNAAVTMIKAPVRVGGALWRMGPRRNRDRTIRQSAGPDSDFNFGALTSVRELAQSRNYRKYFQQVDQNLNIKLIDLQVLDTIVTFLDARDIDTSQFEEQRTTILNRGVLVSGGHFNAGSVAVGEHSQARMAQFTQGVQTALRRQGGGETR